MEKNRLIIGLMLVCIYFSFAFVSSAEQNNSLITRDDAVRVINDSQFIIDNMKTNNFSVNYASDLLIEARRTLQLADYAEIMRNDSATPIERATASQALNLIDWKGISYADVIASTDKIKAVQQQAFLVLDSITAINLRIDNEKKLGTDIFSTETIIQNAQVSFNAERYDEALNLTVNAGNELDRASQEKARLAVFKIYSVNFFQQYWYYLLGVFILGFVIFLLLRGKIKKYNLIKKITHFRAEQQVLTNLIMRTQNERYKENKISGLVYNIRIRKYQERMNEIKESLPVLEAKLHGKKPRRVRIGR